MATYLIGFDLNKEGSAYQEANEKLSEAIKSLSSTWWHHLDSTWIVVSEMSAEQIRDRLSPHIDSNSELLVARASGEGAWKGFNQKGSDWLKSHL